jgi:hypothetical protein
MEGTHSHPQPDETPKGDTPEGDDADGFSESTSPVDDGGTPFIRPAAHHTEPASSGDVDADAQVPATPEPAAPVAAPPSGPREATWADDPAFRAKLWYAYLAICVILIGGDLAGIGGHHDEGHGAAHGSLSDFPGFYGIAGLVAGAVLIFGAKLLGMILNRPEDYYGE